MALCGCRCLGKEDTLLKSKAQITRGESQPCFPVWPLLGRSTAILYPYSARHSPGHLKVLSSHTVCVCHGGVCVINSELGFLPGSGVLILEASDRTEETEVSDSFLLLSLIQETKVSRDFLGLHDPSFMERTRKQVPWLSAFAYFEGLENKRTLHHKPPNLIP